MVFLPHGIKMLFSCYTIQSKCLVFLFPCVIQECADFKGHLITNFYDYAGLAGRKLVMMDGGLILFVGSGVVM